MDCLGLNTESPKLGWSVTTKAKVLNNGLGVGVRGHPSHPSPWDIWQSLETFLLSRLRVWGAARMLLESSG